ncbi:unnamed protein product, partial [Mesorhabditis spiculigera]
MAQESTTPKLNPLDDKFETDQKQAVPVRQKYRIHRLTVLMTISRLLNISIGIIRFALFHTTGQMQVVDVEKTDCPQEAHCYHQIIRLMESAVWHIGGCDRETTFCRPDALYLPGESCTGSQLGNTVCCCIEENCNFGIIEEERPDEMARIRQENPDAFN